MEWILITLFGTPFMVILTSQIINFLNNLCITEKGISNKWSLLGLIGLFLIVPAFMTNVSTGEVGIKTRWGKVIGTNIGEGLQLKAPWEEIVRMDIKVKKYENEVPLSTSSKDLQIVNNIAVAVNYQLRANKSVDLYRNIGEEYEDTIFLPALQESVKGVISKFTAEELVTKRSEISNAINEDLNAKIGDYGIDVLSVAIKNFDFSQEYSNAIEQKAVAEQQVLTAKQQQEKAKVEAETKRIEAEGEAKANEAVEKSLTKEILLEKYLDKWDGKLSAVSASNGVLIDFESLFK